MGFSPSGTAWIQFAIGVILTATKLVLLAGQLVQLGMGRKVWIAVRLTLRGNCLVVLPVLGLHVGCLLAGCSLLLSPGKGGGPMHVQQMHRLSS